MNDATPTLFAVRFYDNPDSASVREQYLAAHLDWLDQQRDSILAAGSLRADSEEAIGGLWIVRAKSRAEVEAMFSTDPFWVYGLRARFEIHSWSRAFPSRPVHF